VFWERVFLESISSLDAGSETRESLLGKLLTDNPFSQLWFIPIPSPGLIHFSLTQTTRPGKVPRTPLVFGAITASSSTSARKYWTRRCGRCLFCPGQTAAASDDRERAIERPENRVAKHCYFLWLGSDAEEPTKKIDGQHSHSNSKNQPRESTFPTALAVSKR